MLLDVALFLFAATVAVPLFKRLGLGAVLGYLAAGIVIGPSVLGLIEDVDSTLHLSELGVVLLLFVIGLELQPSRLWRLRGQVFGLGGAQLLLTAAAIGGAGYAAGLGIEAAVVVGFGLAMSSTAFVLQLLAERRDLTTRHGRGAFAILLLQDVAVIPLLALVPLLGGREMLGGVDLALSVLKTVAVLAALLLSGRYLLRPLLRTIAAADVPEVFTGTALLVVLGNALIMQAVGLSMSLGAFLAGVMLADSEFRHELQAAIEPFKGLLLGLFFIAVGMSADLDEVYAQPALVLLLVLGLIAIKALVLLLLGTFNGFGRPASVSLAAALSQGGEFGFVLFGIATASGILSVELQSLLIVVVTLSMLMTPLMYRLASSRGSRTEEPQFDEIDARETDVVIAGFGPFGQIISRILRVKKYSFTILERNVAHVNFVRQFGNAVFYSDAARIEVLRAAKVGRARAFVIAISDPTESLRVAETVRRHYPRLPVIACARTRRHAVQLMNMGVEHVIRRSFYSSLEATRTLLTNLGETHDETDRVIELFREHDSRALLRQQAVSGDEKQLIQTALQSARELEQLFEDDPGAPKGGARV